MAPNTLRVHTEYVLVKTSGPKVLWAESRVQGTRDYIPSLQSHGKIVEEEIGGLAIYCHFRGFRRANSYCHLANRSSRIVTGGKVRAAKRLPRKPIHARWD
ncbi:uncharacterized protein TNCV_4928131 [Trichonephila clavipes]|nr:uncharacterized protein TNCV_4928131 [Trichonephila clavipes]